MKSAILYNLNPLTGGSHIPGFIPSGLQQSIASGESLEVENTLTNPL